MNYCIHIHKLGQDYQRVVIYLFTKSKFTGFDSFYLIFIMGRFKKKEVHAENDSSDMKQILKHPRK